MSPGNLSNTSGGRVGSTASLHRIAGHRAVHTSPRHPGVTAGRIVSLIRPAGIKYTVILQPETDPEFAGYYNVSVPALPGCFTYGATREEALANAREAIGVYLEDLEANGEPLPEDRLETIGVEV